VCTGVTDPTPGQASLERQEVNKALMKSAMAKMLKIFFMFM